MCNPGRATAHHVPHQLIGACRAMAVCVDFIGSIRFGEIVREAIYGTQEGLPGTGLSKGGGDESPAVSQVNYAAGQCG